MALTTELANHEAEQAVLGYLMMHPGEEDKTFLTLKARDFSDQRNRDVFRTMQTLRAEKKPADAVTLMDANPALDAVYLADLVQKSLLSGAQLAAYRDILKSETARRDFHYLADKVEKACSSVDFSAPELIEKIRLFLKNMTGAETEATGINDDLIEMYDEITTPQEQNRGIMLGVDGLDRLTGGFKPARMYVIGARPSVGKTVFGINAALKAAIAGKPVLYINREMQKTDLLKRMTANLSGVGMAALENGMPPMDQLDKVMDSMAVMSKLPIHISNTAKTPAEIRAKAMELSEEGGLGIVVVDYLQRLTAGERFRVRDEEIGFMSRSLKDLAMDLNVPVILLSQLNRSATNTRPNMAMLRESGNIEQDADVIVLLHAPDTDDVPGGRRDDYRRVTMDGGRYLEMIVDKNRHGTTGIIPVAFYGSRMKYYAIGGGKHVPKETES